MYQLALEKFEQILSGVHPLILFLLVISIGIYVFWRGSSETRKNNSSIFDAFIFSSVVGLVAGRISYILSNWSNFSRFMWYWLPYEKYGNEVFWFRVLPWRFLRVWDWGIDILLMFVGFLLFMTFWVLIIKKWRWNHLFTTIFFSAQLMLGASFFLLGGLIANTDWITQGAIMILVPLTLYLLKNSVRAIMIGKKEAKVLMILDTFFILLLVMYTSYTYFSIQISNIERGGVVVFLVWTLLGIVLNIADSNRANVTIEKVSSVDAVYPIDINQPIKLPK